MPSTVCLTFDFDALSVWLAYDRVTPAMLGRGEFGARVGVPRVLDLLALARPRRDVLRPRAHGRVVSGGDGRRSSRRATRSRTTRTRTSIRAGRAATRRRADMERAFAALAAIGVTPLGFRSPSADLSDATLELVEEHGFLYDSSLMTDDYRPFRPRIGDRVSRAEPARARPRGAVLGAAAELRARRLGALPVQLRPVPQGRRPAAARARDLGGGVRLDGRERRRRRARRHHAPAGDRPRLPDRDAGRVHPPLRRGGRASSGRWATWRSALGPAA